MPTYHGESQKKWMEKCIPFLKKEGKSQSQAVGQCLGMFKSAQKKTQAEEVEWDESGFETDWTIILP